MIIDQIHKELCELKIGDYFLADDRLGLVIGQRVGFGATGYIPIIWLEKITSENAPESLPVLHVRVDLVVKIA